MMKRAVLIDEHDDELIYRFKTEQGTKYLFKIVKLFDDDDTQIGSSIEYFDRQEWHQIAERHSTNRQYCVKLAMSLLSALPDGKRD